MGWEIVERCEGFVVRQAPARDGWPEAYTADFNSKKLANTPFRGSVEEAKQDGLMVRKALDMVQQLEDEEARAAKQSISTRPSGQSFTTPEAQLQHNQPPGSYVAAPLFVPRAWDAEMDFLFWQWDRELETSSEVEQAVPEDVVHPQRGMFVELDEYYDSKIQGVDVQLDRHLGAGGFANVFAGVTQPKPGVSTEVTTGGGVLGMEVAVKVFDITRPGVSGELLQQMAGKEKTTMVWLQGQPHVVKVLASGQLTQKPNWTTAQQHTVWDDHAASAPIKCLVLEFMSNSLASYLEYAVRVSEVDAKPVIRQLAQQLAVLHSGQLDGRLLVHGDIKPDNILMRLNGCIAISDFGTCKAYDVFDGISTAVAQEVDSGLTFASPYCAAPELYNLEHTASRADRCDFEGIDSGGTHVEASPGTSIPNTSLDVFGLGVVLLRMLAGPLEGLFPDAPRDFASARSWEGLLARIVNRTFALPGWLKLSDEALEFLGCACGVGAARDVAAQAGQAKRLGAAELLTLAWLQ